MIFHVRELRCRGSRFFLQMSLTAENRNLLGNISAFWQRLQRKIHYGAESDVEKVVFVKKKS